MMQNSMYDFSDVTAQNNMKYFDKIPLKFNDWKEEDFLKQQIRVIPGTIVRLGSYIGKNTVLMSSLVNIGAYIGENTMIDTWASVGSCAQIGKNCHISGGVGIGGVLEPLQANPVIIEDNCFIGARSEIAEGVIVGEGAVLSMGVYIGQSTKIVDRQTGSITYGYVPPYSVVVPGTIADKNGYHLYCVYIVKKVDAVTRSKTSINQILRESTIEN
jgi:2,3,4,5-tetrahydropyridine-2-carboxylate N-succinyltransferase